jgi:hypothetical protein
MNLATNLLIGILSIATATMWFVAFALWLRSSAGLSAKGIRRSTSTARVSRQLANLVRPRNRARKSAEGARASIQ